MKRFVIGLAAALVSAGAVLAASQPPGVVRQAVQHQIDTAMAPDPEDADDADQPPPPKAPGAMFRRVNVNNDGVDDWAVDFEKAPNASYFCGTGGCVQQVYVSDGAGGFSLAFDTNVRQFKLRRLKGQTVIDVDFHGSTCSGFGVDPCPRGYRWDTAAARFLERPLGAATFLISGPSRPTLLPEASLPSPVRALLGDKVRACKAIGRDYPYQDAFFTDVSDLNGDGVRDWVVGGGYDSCAYVEGVDAPDPAFGVVVFVSTPSGFVRAYEADTPAWGLDLAGPHARFVTLSGAEECGLDGKDCQRTYWRWDGTALVSQAATQP